MTFYRNLMLALLTSFSVLASSDEVSDCGGSGDASANESRPCVLRGNFAYKLEGRFGIPAVGGLLANSFAEIGVLSIDGSSATANGVAVINGTVVQNASYSCSLSFPDPLFPVNPRLGLATCTRTAGGVPTGPLTFALAYGDKADHITVNALPAPGTPFAVTQISGYAQK